MSLPQRKLEMLILVVGMLANLPRAGSGPFEFLKEAGFPFVFATSANEGWKLVSPSSAFIDAILWIALLFLGIASKRTHSDPKLDLETSRSLPNV